MAADRELRKRRDNASSPASSTTTLPEKLSLLIHWDDLPPWRRDNAFIHTSYRRITPSYTHALRSLFYLHNESVNIWSHLIGCAIFAASSVYIYNVARPRYLEHANSTDVAVFACFFGGAMLCLGMSATYHGLVDHSEQVAKWGNKLDYTGIVALIVGSYVPALYYGFYCQPVLLQSYLYLICILGAGCATVSWVERFRTPDWRPYRAAMFISLGLSGVIPVVHGISQDGFQAVDDRMSVGLVILHGAMYIFGAVLYAVRWPERNHPGKFDVWGHSHQIFHIFVLMAALTHFYGMAKAFDYHHTVMKGVCAA